MTENNATPSLPPRPDPETGLPRPPHAPKFIGNSKESNQDRDREHRLGRKPQPPAGQGPVLAWYRASWRGTITSGIGGFILLMILFVILSFVKTGSFQLLDMWYLWLLAILAGVGVASSTKVARCSAGADWLQLKTAWVQTYELKEIRTRYLSNTIYVYLTDRKDRKIDAQINLLQEDRLIWDLLYNGVRHSIANGAILTGTAANYFHIGDSVSKKSHPTSAPIESEHDNGSA